MAPALVPQIALIPMSLSPPSKPPRTPASQAPFAPPPWIEIVACQPDSPTRLRTSRDHRSACGACVGSFEGAFIGTVYQTGAVLSAQRCDKLLARACLATKEPCKPVPVSFIAMLARLEDLGVKSGLHPEEIPGRGFRKVVLMP